jgi:D-amino-acid dehydrogenase
MKVIILGSGLLGVTTAYQLAARGHVVEVLERNTQSASETSFANGGQLSYSHAEPWANPVVLPKIPKWMFSSDAPLVLRPRADWQMIKWGLAFLRNCTTRRAVINAASILRLGLYSRDEMEKICKDTGVAFDYNKGGILHIFSTQEELDMAIKQAEFQARLGCEQKIISREECLAMEPALGDTARDIVGGIHAHLDASGDACSFTRELAAFCSKYLGVTFHYENDIENIEVSGKRVTSVVTDKGEHKADAYVMAMGSYSPLLLRPIGINIPVYPMKGYSITLPANDKSPSISVTDVSAKLVYSRLGDRLRIAGTAEFAGYTTNINKKRIVPIVRGAKELFPNAAWDAPMEEWACLRPSTPDGPPVIGRCRYDNLFLNTGHGTLGWTQAAGSATLLADIMEQKTPGIILAGLTIDRYRKS